MSKHFVCQSVHTLLRISRAGAGVFCVCVIAAGEHASVLAVYGQFLRQMANLWFMPKTHPSVDTSVFYQQKVNQINYLFCWVSRADYIRLSCRFSGSPPPPSTTRNDTRAASSLRCVAFLSVAFIIIALFPVWLFLLCLAFIESGEFLLTYCAHLHPTNTHMCSIQTILHAHYQS